MKVFTKISLIISLLFIFLPELIFSQAPDTLWTKTFGGSNIDIGHSVQETFDGGFIITGYTRSFGTASGRNVWLIKTDLSGNELWNNTFGGNDDDEGYSVQQTSDSGYVITGYTKSFGAGSNDVFLIKTNSSGNEEWSSTFGGSQDDEGYSVEQTADDEYIVAGVTSSYGSGSRDVWLIKVDSTGNEVWNKTFGGFSSDGAWSVQQTVDKGYIITGWTFSNGLGYLGNVFLVKADSSGNEEWSKAFGGTDVDRGYFVEQTIDSGYIITGYTSSFGAGLDDMLLIKTDKSGNEEWNKTFGGTGRDYGYSVQQTTNRGYIITGYTLSYGAGGDDVWVVKTDINGNEEWNNTYGGVYSDVGYSIKETSDGGYIITGHTLSYGSGLHDVWLIRIGSNVTEKETQLSISSYALYQNFPNPFNPSTTINYQIPELSFVIIKVYDVLGNEIATLVNEEKPAGKYAVDFIANNLPSGVYLYRLKAGEFVSAKKMIILK
jgi:hypothetical protein